MIIARIRLFSLPRIALVAFVSIFVCDGIQARTLAKERFTIADYFNINHITEVALSADGEMIAYAVERRSAEQNTSARAIYISATKKQAKPVLLSALSDAESLSWIPNKRALLYISEDNAGVSQLYSLDTTNRRIHQHTHSRNNVLKFKVAQNGDALAWLTTRESALSQPPHSECHGKGGVVVDIEQSFARHFLNPEWPNFVSTWKTCDDASRLPHTLWIKHNERGAVAIPVPGVPREFHWSTDGSHLSITYTQDHSPDNAISNRITSIGIYHTGTKSFHVLASGHPLTKSQPRQYYRGGEWVPGENKIFIRRTTDRDAWLSDTEWSVLRLSLNGKPANTDQIWRKLPFHYFDTAFIPVNENGVYSEKIIRARRAVYEIKASGIDRAQFLDGINGAVSHVQFSSDFETAAFVNESLTRPPEIYIWRKETGWKQLTRLNNAITNKEFPNVREMYWNSTDGATVQGWLWEPASAVEGSNPQPLITYVHGGPGRPIIDQFAFTFQEFGSIWPYPIEVFALNGMAVFIPNYRGTKSFGEHFAEPKLQDGEPVDDIVTGIEYLIDEGFADPERLAIMGHSHGSWLGSSVMTRTHRNFRAASFAEGTQNMILTYSLAAAWLNRVTHDAKIGTSLYDNPNRYIELSPELHFSGLRTAVLFEAGRNASAISMIGAPKAARRAGMPTEFIVYPNTGHIINIPRLQNASAERNLDWFLFWLQGYKEPHPEKQEQYARWRKMRDERCAWDEPEDERPSYCEYPNAVH